MKRIVGICKECRYSHLYYGNGPKGDKNPTGVHCSKRNGRLKKAPKECKWFDRKGDS